MGRRDVRGGTKETTPPPLGGKVEWQVAHSDAGIQMSAQERHHSCGFPRILTEGKERTAGHHKQSLS